MILEVEVQIKAAIKQALGSTVRSVETHPGNWGKHTIKKVLTAAPCVLVGFTMGTDHNEDELKTSWHVYLVAKALNGKKEVGIYQMTEQLIVALNGLDLGQVDGLKFKRVKNLFSFAEAQQGVCCYEMSFELLMHPFNQIDASTLDEFKRFHSDTLNESGDVLISADTELTE